MRRLAAGAGVGVLLGVVLLAAEGALVLRANAVGLDFSTEGPFAAVMAAIRPLLPSLVARVAVLYAVSGLALGVLAVALLALSGVERLSARAGLWLLNWVVLLVLAMWRAAVMHPALFDDLPVGRGLLEWVVLRGEPWHPVAAAGAWLALHLAVFAKRRSVAGAVALGLAVVVAVVAARVGLSAALTSTGKGPLVVLLGVDALRPDRLENERLPALRAFRMQATTFTNAWTPLAQTEPAWRSLITARWPHRTGVRCPLTPETEWAALPTFPQALATHGWATVFETDCSRFNHQPPSSGFSIRRQPPKGAINFALEKLRFRGVGVFGSNRVGAWWLPELVDNRALAGVHDPFGYAERLAERLRALNGPALFAFHATATHFPGDPSYPYYRQKLGPEVPLERRVRMHFAPIDRGGAARPGSRAESEALYDELLAQADAQVGTVLQALRDAGRYDEAMVVVFSDHGESFHADHPELAGATPVHGARLGDEENRIALAIKVPGQKEPKTIDGLVRLIDVGPTVLQVAGAAPLAGADGESLWPLLEGKPGAQRLLYAETGFTHARPDAFTAGHLSLAPRTFDAYSVRADGVVEMNAEVYRQAVREKDVGAFDGVRWLVRQPMADGGVVTRCDGGCEALAAWLDSVQGSAAITDGGTR